MRLTPLGSGVLAGGIAMVAFGVGLGFPAALAVGALCLVLVAVGLIDVAGRPDLRVGRLASPPEVSRTTPAEVRLTLTAGSALRRTTTLVERVAGHDRVATVHRVDPQGTVVTYPVDTSRRGVQVCGPLEARRADPFGLVAARTRFGGTCSVSVRPRIYPMRLLPSGRQRDLEGPTRERSEGTASFHQIREYAVGDDLRRIHWRTTARTGTLMVKQMVDTTRPELVVVVDNRDVAITATDFEEAVDVAASLLRAAENDGFPTALLFTGGSPAITATDDGTPVPHLDQLTEIGRSSTDSLLTLSERLVARGRSLVFVTGELVGPDLVAVGRIARGFSPAYLVSVVARRTAPLVPPPGVRAVACSTAAEFVTAWSAAR